MTAFGSIGKILHVDLELGSAMAYLGDLGL